MSDATAGARAGSEPRPPPRGAGIVRLYPPAWRARYGPEVLAMLEELELNRRARIDLARGALDARLHEPSRLPAGAALLAGALWTIAGASTLAAPAPPDWPGYVLETLPLAIVAVGAGIVATIGCWAASSDRAGRLGGAAVVVAVGAAIGWLVALVVALVGIGYGWPTAAAQGLGAVGLALVGLAIVRAGDGLVGGLLAFGAAAMLFAWPAAWLGFGLAWTLTGAVLLARGAPADSGWSAA